MFSADLVARYSSMPPPALLPMLPRSDVMKTIGGTGCREGRQQRLGQSAGGA